MTEEQVFLAALELDKPAERAAYLEKACGGDVELRRQVEELLAAHFRPGVFLDNSTATQANLGGGPVTGEKKPDEETGDLHFLRPPTRADSLGRIGHYEVLQVLGKGGFGIVFRAFDEVL